MINIEPVQLGILGMIIFIALLLLTGVPIGIGMALVGFVGILVMSGGKVALNALYQIPYSATASWVFSVMPMFIFMGYIAFYSGFTKDAYDAAYKWVGRVPGGLAVATLMGATAFGACCGSSAAATAAMGRLAMPEMERYGYDRRMAAGTVTMGGTLAALIPPSILLVLYGVITEQSVGKLLIAGILPGILSATCFILLVLVRSVLQPRLAPRGDRFSWKERVISLRKPIGIAIIFVSMVGGIYTGVFTPTEAGAVGASVTFVLALAMRRLNWPVFKEVVYESIRVFSYIMLIIIGAHIFIRFLALTRLPIELADWVVTLPINRMVVYAGTVVVYLILGCFLDALGVLLLTVPFISPAIFALGFDPLWFGIIVVKLLEIGLITPPVGIQAFILKGVVPSLTLEDIFIGFIPFFLVDLFVVIGLLTVFPQISLVLPSMMR